jgi:two-component system, LytTR family, sensor kinase
MVLQPIVENAVRHGLGQSEEAVTIDVAAAAGDGMLALVVADDGPGLSASRAGQAGIGLTNTRSRLARLYGAKSELVVEHAIPRGVRVTVRLPLRTAQSEDDACR